MIWQPQLQIAVGNNNVAGLVALEAITPTNDKPFLPVRNYGTFDVGLTKIRMTGTPYFAGQQVTRFIAQVMTIAQFAYLKITYCSGGYSGLVTVRFRANNPTTYANYNATLILQKEADLEYKQSHFLDVVLSFINLQVIP